MNRKLKPTKSVIQARDEQVAAILEDLEKDLENFKKAIQSKDKQLVDLETILKAGKSEYQKVAKENEYFKDYIEKNNKYNNNNKKQRQFPKKNIQKKYVKKLFTNQRLRVNQKLNNKKRETTLKQKNLRKRREMNKTD